METYRGAEYEVDFVPKIKVEIVVPDAEYKGVVEAISRSGAGLYPITVGRFVLTNDDTERDRSVVLDTAPKVSGGQRFTLLSSHAIEATLARVARHLTSQYRVVYSRPETLIPPEKIEVTSSQPGLTVHGTPARATGGVQ